MGRLASSACRASAAGWAEGRRASGLGRLWAASVVSRFGDGLRVVALPLLAARLTDDPGLVAWVSAAGFLPWLLFALPAGVLVDRADRGRLLWGVDAVRAVAVGAFSITVMVGWATIPLLAALAFVLAACQTLSETAFQSFLPAVVGHDQLSRANSRLGAGEIVTEQFAGAALGGILLSRLPAGPFLIDAVSFAASAAILVPFDGHGRPAAPPTQKPALLEPVLEGFRWLRDHTALLFVCCFFTLWNLALAGTTAIAVLWAQGPLGLSEAQFGLFFLAPAAGGLLGALAAPRLGERLGRERALVLSMLGLTLSFGGLGLAPHALVAGMFLALDGLMGGLWNVLSVSLRQALVPGHLLGRVTSVFRFFGRGVRPVGALLGGMMAEAYGLHAPFLAAGAVLSVPALVALPLLATQRSPAHPAEAPT